MQSVEAMTRLIGLADELIKEDGVLILGDKFVEDDQGDLISAMDEIKVAAAVANAMLNTALPVAKYRVFVRYDRCFPKEDIGLEFTICAVQMKAIRAALAPLDLTSREVYITVFEQRATGAEMVSGYQGPTHTLNKKFKKWLDSLALIDLQNLIS